MSCVCKLGEVLTYILRFAGCPAPQSRQPLPQSNTNEVCYSSASSKEEVCFTVNVITGQTCRMGCLHLVVKVMQEQ
jgi:hypothetical protein